MTEAAGEMKGDQNRCRAKKSSMREIVMEERCKGKGRGDS